MTKRMPQVSPGDEGCIAHPCSWWHPKVRIPRSISSNACTRLRLYTRSVCSRSEWKGSLKRMGKYILKRILLMVMVFSDHYLHVLCAGEAAAEQAGGTIWQGHGADRNAPRSAGLQQTHSGAVCAFSCARSLLGGDWGVSEIACTWARMSGTSLWKRCPPPWLSTPIP